MKSLTEYLWFEVPDHRGFVNLTGTVYGEFDSRRRLRVLVKIIGE